ncbi:DUF397 domain-containing protein [Nocardiopsis sp. NPDC055879]
MSEWYKSSYSGGDNDCVEITHNLWHKSSYSGGDNNCVEVTELGSLTGMRDTQNRELGALFFSADEWQAFLRPA